MKKYEEHYLVLIKNNTVIGTIVVNPEDKEFLGTIAKDYDKTILVGERNRPSPGWIYKNDNFGSLEPTVPEPPEPKPPEVKSAEPTDDKNN